MQTRDHELEVHESVFRDEIVATVEDLLCVSDNSIVMMVMVQLRWHRTSNSTRLAKKHLPHLRGIPS